MNAPTVLTDGTWIDNFRIVRRLGRGGFGITYLAEEFREWEAGEAGASPLRMVAIKEYFPRGLATRPDGHTVTLTQDIDGAEAAFHMALKGFFQEAESLMRFDHPNVIKIHRVFQRNGTAYYVMPFLKGETLKAILKREGALSEERTRRIMLPILDGLIHAHAKGILHRDLKPDNVMVPDEGGPVLIDFGAARAQAVDEAAEYTRYSELVAYTPGYAALEQYGRATRDNPHGPQTDVYGLAAVMYHCVTGEAPVEASQRSMQLSNGAQDPLVPAAARMIESLGLSRAFLCAIDWGMELAGRNRPQTVADFRRALDGRLSLPEVTLTRLETHGVSTDPFTQPGPHTLPIHPRAAGAPRLQSEPTDTVLADPASLPSMPTRPTQNRAAQPGPATQMTLSAPVRGSGSGADTAAPTTQAPPTLTPPTRSPAAGSPTGRLLPIGALLVSLLAIGYVAREPLQDGLRTLLAPAEVAPPPPAPEVEVAPATPAEDPQLVAEREAFEAAKSSDTLEGWKAFKKAFPDSALVATADIRIAALQRKPAKSTEPKPAEKPAVDTETETAKLQAPEVKPAPVPGPSPTTKAAPRPLGPGGVRDCVACPEVVKLAGGRYAMGDATGSGEANERPVREVTIAPFYAGRYEVTFPEWEACVADGGCEVTTTNAGWGRNSRPVTSVSWNDAQRYVAWLSVKTGKRYRLPSEAEFEFMNRAGGTSLFPWGDDDSGACTHANVADEKAKSENADWATLACDDGAPGPTSVGQYSANAFGLYDVSGNVWEWTADCFHGYKNAATDGSAVDSADCARRMIRGGSWADSQKKLRSSYRTASPPTATLPILGFRVVRDP